MNNLSSEYKKRWYMKNKDRIREIKKLNENEIKKKRQEYYEKNKNKIKQKRKEHYEKNKEQNSKNYKVYQEKNREKILVKKKEYRHKNSETIKAKKKEWDFKNRDKINAYVNNKKKTDKLFKISSSARNLINKAIKRNGYGKNTKTELILGCSFEEFKQHLEINFESWMNWNNYGLYNGTSNYGWDIDHIIPSSNALNEEELLKLNHFSNLQPLCSYVNRDVKKDKVYNNL